MTATEGYNLGNQGGFEVVQTEEPGGSSLLTCASPSSPFRMEINFPPVDADDNQAPHYVLSWPSKPTTPDEVKHSRDSVYGQASGRYQNTGSHAKPNLVWVNSEGCAADKHNLCIAIGDVAVNGDFISSAVRQTIEAGDEADHSPDLETLNAIFEEYAFATPGASRMRLL